MATQTEKAQWYAMLMAGIIGLAVFITKMVSRG